MQHGWHFAVFDDSTVPCVVIPEVIPDLIVQSSLQGITFALVIMSGCFG